MVDFELILKELNDKLLQLNEFLSICLQSCIIEKKMIRFNKNLRKYCANYFPLTKTISCLNDIRKVGFPFLRSITKRELVRLFDTICMTNKNGHQVHTKEHKNIDVALQRYDEKYNCTLL